jgi:hypothetical protein
VEPRRGEVVISNPMQQWLRLASSNRESAKLKEKCADVTTPK